MSNTQLDEVVAGEPPAVQDEVRSINTDATDLALQVALLVPILAGLVGLFSSFRMVRLPDVAPAAPLEGAVAGLTHPQRMMAGPVTSAPPVRKRI